MQLLQRRSEMGCRTHEASTLSLSYPLAEGVRLTFLRIAGDVATTVSHLDYPGLDGAPLVALGQLRWLERQLQLILSANELSLSVVLSVNQPTTSTAKDCVSYATANSQKTLYEKT